MNDITVILNAFKRPQHFWEQLAAIQEQSVPVKKIMVWQNAGGNDPEIEFADIRMDLYEDNDNMGHDFIWTESNHNFGVWARFAYALNAKTEYVCIFDDDTIPGYKWLENCLDTMKTHEGLLGSVGIRFHSKGSYHPVKRYGWADINNTKPMEVDLVGHSWFFKREWLSYMWRELPEPHDVTIVGEDMHFSFMLRKYGNINTYIPPHPPEQKELWGSQPETGWRIGQDSAAVSMNMKNIGFMSHYVNKMMNNGFIPIRFREDFVEDENPFKY